MDIEVKIKRIRADAVIPVYATKGSAGMDVCYAADEPILLKCGERKLIPTGLAMSADSSDVVLLMYARSGLSLKHGITMINGVGVIDSDYRGEIMCPMVNLGSEDYVINPGERIAQIVFTPVLSAKLISVDTLDDTERGQNGFGSTGK